jgi:hypothetical protein
MEKFLELYVLLTETEKQILLEKYGDLMSLKFFLSRSLDKIIQIECDEIEMGKPFISTIEDKEPA